MLLGAEKQAVVGEVSVAQTRVVSVEAGGGGMAGLGVNFGCGGENRSA